MRPVSPAHQAGAPQQPSRMPVGSAAFSVRQADSTCSGMVSARRQPGKKSCPQPSAPGGGAA